MPVDPPVVVNVVVPTGAIISVAVGMIGLVIALFINGFIVAYKYGQLNTEVKQLRIDVRDNAGLHQKMTATIQDLSNKIVALETTMTAKKPIIN